MGANKLEAFEIGVITRDKIHEADYNPRKIDEAARKKIKKFLKAHGQWSPLIVNKRNNILVSGHQRLSMMDSILKAPDYELTVSLIDVDEETEVKGNIFLNNQSAMGEFDYTKLGDIHDIFPEIDFVNDLGFDESDTIFILGEDPVRFNEDLQESMNNVIADNFMEDNEKSTKKELNQDDFREIKAKDREKLKERKENGDIQFSETDYNVTFVFPNTREKQAFMKKINKKPGDKFVKSTILTSIYNHEYNLSLFESDD